MKRTQVQFSDSLYLRLKRLARQQETTLASIVRQASVQYLETHPAADTSEKHWSPPEPVDMGLILAPESEWRTLANEALPGDPDRK